MSQHSVRNLFVLGYGHGTTMWGYTTPDSRREIEGQTYWHGAPENMKPGDWIFVTHQHNLGNTIYALIQQPTGGLQARRLCSTFAED